MLVAIIMCYILYIDGHYTRLAIIIHARTLTSFYKKVCRAASRLNFNVLSAANVLDIIPSIHSEIGYVLVAILTCYVL